MQQAVLRVSVILLLVVAVAATAAYLFMSDDDNLSIGPATGRPFADALLQNLGEQEGCEPRDGDGNIDWEAEFLSSCHNHRNYTQHQLSTPNVELVGFDPNLGNAEIQVAEAPDGRTYVYQAGWNEMRIIDVTDPHNMTQVGRYYDPNTQVLDVKYIEFGADEYVIIQNQIVDPGAADPNVGEWGDPAQVTVTLVDVTDKTDPDWVDSWYDADHPSGPHNLYTQMIDSEWYIFVANPDYDECDIGTGEACGGVTIAHLNLPGSAAHLIPNGPVTTINKVGEYEVNWATTRGGWIYIHDLTVQRWPGEDPLDPRFERTYIYGAYWEAGLRIGDVSDVPHPVNSPELYVAATAACKGSIGVPGVCNWRAPEVGQWMDFADFDGDGQPDSSTTGNVNGGRASYIHYVEPFPVLVDASHLGLGDTPRHVTFLATEVLETSVGTGLVYVLDTTDYEMVNGNMRFKPQLLSYWENPYGPEHFIPGGEQWLIFSPHNHDSAWFPTTPETDSSLGGGWDGRIYMGNYHSGLWVIDLETMMAPPFENMTDLAFAATVGYYLPHGADGAPLDSDFYDFGWIPNLWTAEYYKGYVYLSCITSGLYIVQLDLDMPYTGVDYG
jgi:hypothetical protein